MLIESKENTLGIFVTMFPAENGPPKASPADDENK